MGDLELRSVFIKQCPGLTSSFINLELSLSVVGFIDGGFCHKVVYVGCLLCY